jgi:hypothetical protein
MKLLLWHLVIVALVWSQQAFAPLICENVVVSTAVTRTDVLFVIDASGSMGSKIAGVASGVVAFANSLLASGIDARFAVVRYGGSPVIFMPFTVGFIAEYPYFTTCVE